MDITDPVFRWVQLGSPPRLNDLNITESNNSTTYLYKWSRINNLRNSNSKVSKLIISPSGQFSSFDQSASPWSAAGQDSLSITNSQSLLKLMSIKLEMSSKHLILCRPLLVLPLIFPSIRVFSSESVLRIRCTKYWSFSFSISSSSEYSGLISFRIDWLDLLAVQGTLKSFLQHHSSKASILCSAFFIVQLSHPYMTTGKTIALTTWNFVDKVMSLIFIYLFIYLFFISDF